MRHLARERFYWPNMENDVVHIVTKVYPCLKQRQLNLATGAPLQISALQHLLNWCPWTSYIWNKVLVVISTFLLTISPDLLRPMQPRINQAQLQLKANTMTRRDSIWFSRKDTSRSRTGIKKKKNSFTNCKSLVESRIFEPLRTIH